MTGTPFLCWLDIETTGLDPELDYLLEVGIVLTTPELEPIADYSVVICDDPAPVMARAMVNDVVTKMHMESGLFSTLPHGVPLAQAERELLSWLTCQTTGYDPMPLDLGPMCGSSVHFDRAFLKRHMPGLEAEFHYRNLDVSGIREAAKLWAPHLVETAPAERKLHRALPDLEDTLALARHFRDELFRSAVAAP